ncbi:MAG: SulP family inorganic anion transporter [Proteobacteria bacterium]|nr:SulP family inorganic anion transporter [Pseudomonadota bacterium]
MADDSEIGLKGRLRALGLWSLPTLKGDLAGGAAASLVSLPISMTVGVIAFAPLGKDFAVQGVLAGIYGAVALGIFAALFGARSIMMTGPRAASALIIASLMTNLLASDDLLFPSGQTVHYVIAITFFAMFMAGAIQFLAGRTGIANIVKNIPQPVAAGFMNSAALIVIIKQSWALLDIPKQEFIFDYLAHLGEARPMTMIPGVIAIAVMILAKKRLPQALAPVASLFGGTAAFYILRSALKGADVGTTLGEVTSRLPVPQVPDLFTSLTAGGDVVTVMLLVVPAALSLAALASMETALTLSALDEVTGRRTDSNREIAGHGLGNMAASLIGGVIGSGAMLRSRPGYDAGGRTPAMGVFLSLIMLAVVLGFADLIQFIPRAVIAGMILIVGFQSFDRWSFGLFRRFFTGFSKVRWALLLDIFIIVLVVWVALAFDLIVAVGVGIVVSVIVFVSRMSRSLVRREFRGPAIHSRSVWNERRQAALKDCGHRIAVLELEGAIFFGTAEGLEERVHDLTRNGVTHVVLDLKRIKYIDSTGAFVLQRIDRQLAWSGGVLALSYILPERRESKRIFKGSERRMNVALRSVWRALQDTGTVDAIGEDAFFTDTDSALAFCENNLLQAVAETSDVGAGSRNNTPAILNGLDGEEIRKIRRMFTRHVFAAGATIFQEGDDGDALYYITRGRADVYVDVVESGYRKRLLALLRGAVFGEMALLDNKPRAASVVAAQDTICYRLGIDAFERLKKADYEIALKLFNNICIMFSQRLRSSNAMITELEK